MKIVEEIGVPALFEQTAEECVELAHICMKLARKLRQENPTPIDIPDIMSKLYEETADVMLCIEILKDEGYLPNTEYTEKIMHCKELRWVERLEEWNK